MTPVLKTPLASENGSNSAFKSDKSLCNQNIPFNQGKVTSWQAMANMYNPFTYE